MQLKWQYVGCFGESRTVQVLEGGGSFVSVLVEDHLWYVAYCHQFLCCYFGHCCCLAPHIFAAERCLANLRT